MPIFRLNRRVAFPPAHWAGPEGLLAIGGDLSVPRLLTAYRQGIFPWYSRGEPVLWWSPDPRLVLYPSRLHVSRSLRKVIRQRRFHITFDAAFVDVIESCALNRLDADQETWLDGNMIRAYIGLHARGYAHSVEAWQDGNLAGGLYGVALGRCFFGESMFSRVSNASKTAFVSLIDFLRKRRFHLVDCQVSTEHLRRLGAEEISRKRFLSELAGALGRPTIIGHWRKDGNVDSIKIGMTG